MSPAAQSMDPSSPMFTVGSSSLSIPEPQSAFLFSMNPPKSRPFRVAGDGFGRDNHNSPQEGDQHEEQRKKVLQLKKRFLKNPAITGAYFAKREVRRKMMREVGWKDGIGVSRRRGRSYPNCW